MGISTLRQTAVSIIKELPDADVYLVGGPSGAGKTEFAKAFSAVRPILVIALDDYFLDENMVRISSTSRYGDGPQWDHPSSLDLQHALRNVRELLDESYTQLPTYSFAENRRGAYRPCRRPLNASILVEGLHALLMQSDLRSSSRTVYSVFIDADVKVRRERIRVRDTRDRGKPLSDFDRAFHFTRIAEPRWILPQRREADLLLDTSEDVFRIR